MDDELLTETSACRIGRPFPLADQTAHEPDIALVGHDPWVVWSGRGRDGDCVYLRELHGGAPALAVSSRRGVETQPCVVPMGDGALRLLWIAYRDHAWHLLSREFRDGTLGEETSLVQNPVGLFHPRAQMDAAGRCWIVYEDVHSGVSRLAVLQPGESRPRILQTPPGSCARPAVSPGPGDGLWVAYDCYHNGHFGVFLQRIDRPSSPIPVSGDSSQNLHPSLDKDLEGNLWVVWASNSGAPFRDRWWLTKWVCLRRFNGESFDAPAAPQPGRNLANEDAWQGWEFPAVRVDAYGRVWLFGQASHTIYAQYLDGGGWSSLFSIDQRRWGSWKPRARVTGNNPVYLVTMGLRGAQAHRIAVLPRGGSIQLTSQPEDPPLQRLAPVQAQRPSLTTQGGEVLTYYFGDLHAHSTYSDALNDVDEVYCRYRDAYGYDFAAVTDHDFLDGIELSQSELKVLWNHADRVTRRGVFIAMYGYEWTAPALADHAGRDRTVGEGHRHILYADPSGPLVSYGEESANTGKKLLERLQGVRALVIPHHTAWSGTDWDAHDVDLQRLVEVCSTHGRFEYPGNAPIRYRRDHLHPGKFVVDALARGYRLGFVGGSDSHGLRWHATEMEGRAGHVPPGTRVGWKEDAFRTGMTAILAPELTREALFEALYQRRCYATSGEPIVVDFRVNNELMGSMVTVAAAPQLTVAVRGTASLRALDIVRSGHLFGGVQCLPGEGMKTLEVSLEDTMIIPGEEHYYYVRVVQEDGNMAWSSPIWVQYRRK